MDRRSLQEACPSDAPLPGDSRITAESELEGQLRRLSMVAKRQLPTAATEQAAEEGSGLALPQTRAAPGGRPWTSLLCAYIYRRHCGAGANTNAQPGL